MTLRTAHIPGNKPSPGKRMTFEEFLEAEFDHHHYEWVDGEAIEMAAVDFKHADLRDWLVSVLRYVADDRGLGKVTGEPFLMKASDDLPGRSPDIVFIRTERVSLIDRDTLRGPADVVIEVASPGTRSLDRTKKFREYEAGGVGEYWIVDPHRQTAEFFVLQNGSLIPGEVDENQNYRTPLFPGVWFNLEWFWTLPATSILVRTWSAS